MANKLRPLTLVISCFCLILLFNNCSGSKSQNNSPTNENTNNVPTKVGINTEKGWSDSPFISRDGKRLYFMYSRYDYSTYIGHNILPSATGPDRPGLHKSETNAWDESDIYMSTKNDDGTWSEPVPMPFNGDYADASGMEIDNGNTFVWLHGSALNGANNNLVIVQKDANGNWSAPVSVGSGINNHSINSSGQMSRQDNPYLSPDGLHLYYLSTQNGGLGGTDLWYSNRVSGSWSAPVNLGSPFNTSGDEDQPWISGSDVYWNLGGTIKHCVSNGSTCASAPESIVIPGCNYAAEVSMPDDKQTMYFACGDTSTFRIKIMYSKKQSDGSWGVATPID